MLRLDRRTLLWCAALTGAEKATQCVWEALQAPKWPLDAPPWHPGGKYEPATHRAFLDAITIDPEGRPFPRAQWDAVYNWVGWPFQKPDHDRNVVTYFCNVAEFRVWMLAAARMYIKPITNVNQRQHRHKLHHATLLYCDPSITQDISKVEIQPPQIGVHYTPAALYRLIKRSHAGDPLLNGERSDPLAPKDRVYDMNPVAPNWAKL